MRPIRTILHPTDFSSGAELATELAIEMAVKFNAELTLLHTYAIQVYIGPLGETYPLSAETVYKIQDTAERSLELIRKRASEAGVKAKSQIVDGVDSEVILATAKSAGIDLIVMGTHGRTGLKHFLLGSVAEKVVRLASCPVLTVRAPA
jgi:nucleotide-binding universal stress UspA family protein